ncbi:hypothetical protein P4361_18815 [Fictibacillus sp. B-59209]|uniref:hypothetical protein n=1 Tax=Fictibacillus sp. B-59209 TaxID=3024873 RepID=UPI002E1F7E01|nr:hypothetical protein [Fictibacillus sp. B-59209]
MIWPMIIFSFIISLLVGFGVYYSTRRLKNAVVMVIIAAAIMTALTQTLGIVLVAIPSVLLLLLYSKKNSTAK